MSPDDQKKLNYWNELFGTVQATGLMFLEAWTCEDENCGVSNFYAHMGMEAMKCVSCGKTHASEAPRKPGPGEPTVAVYESAVKIVGHVGGHANAEMVPLGAEEIKALPIETRVLLARHRLTVATETCKMVELAVEELSTNVNK